MKRLHIHIGVENLDRSIEFYNALFGAQPVKTKTDYAKWMLEDPSVNFAISTRSGKQGVDHLGIQVDQGPELDTLRGRIKEADMSIFDEGETVCCYARSDKSWVKDPSGIAWEAYQTMDDAEFYTADEASDPPSQSGAEPQACCAPQSEPEQSKGSSCCAPAKKKTGCC
ncbi:VOC family protein [Aestuariirhabdus sp. Z084]|uniref:ArsI/CadI family heavy metal resistance metalloenzyme n=1 Tax=Aestuariirhabdus haliotis TaxID=2918751 RepID=UPI00201B420A|nr:ArsI/CadI family heavy metal resistance metalloenzyme [Aestuariirhabdus haliotis]MCL6417672.1 VOC family protein [Aestuariirhabdus haliotis]MCL6421601.1 VOC family protein [Aestuariirhabdus haliotis]